MDTEQYQNSLGDEEEEDDDESVDESSFVQDITDSSHHAQNSNPPSFSFGGRQQQQISIDPALDTPPPENHGGDNQHHHNQQQQQHAQQNHFVNTQIPRQIYTDIARSASQFSLPDHGGAGFSSPSPAPPPKILPAFTPTDRRLPDRVVTDETLDDAYITFILYCNPSVPLDCDTTELRKAFRLPPKSDGKTFNVHHLLQLIEKFEGKEIKTWTKLATELGVERTVDQSAQKVQQYAVRLKRWMHAMHIDAFFEYVLNKPHAYYQQIPHLTSSPNQEQMRDGVPLEEDLALRALHPETRPKRGRRKTDDKDDDGTDKDMPDPKRQHLDTPTPSTAEPTSAMDFNNAVFLPHPQSAVSSAGGADGMDRFLDEDPWTAATQSVLSGGGNSGTSTGGQQYRWRAFPREGTTPSTTQPPITILTSNEGNQTPIDEVPTPTTPASGSKPRSRRRHGPAVSSAWPSSGNPLTGKLRGRPPSNRSVRDGPFSTFPANPTGKGHTIDLSPGGVGITATPTSTPIASHAPPHQYTFRPQQLHLTVPTRTGGHIGIASPASAITPHPHINGNGIPWKREKSPLGRSGNGTTYTSSGVSSLGLDDIEQKFSAALLQADGVLLRVEDAKKISERVVAGLRRSWPDSGEAEERAIATIMGCGDDTGGEGGCRDVRIMKLRGERRGELDDLGLGEDVDDDLGDDDGGARYDIRWSVMLGPVKGEFSQVVTLGPLGGFHRMNSGLSTLGDDDDSGLKGLDGLEGFDDSGGGENVDELRKRVAELERRVKDREREIRGVKEKVLKAVVS